MLKLLEYLSKCFENMQQISVEGDLDVSVYDVSGLGCVCRGGWGGGGWKLGSMVFVLFFFCVDVNG